MNSFYYNQDELITFFEISNDSNKNGGINCDTLKSKIKEVISDSSERDNIIYIYYLLDNKKFNYPLGDGSDVLYIGKTIGEKKGQMFSVSDRFVHLKAGKDYKQNITLGIFYNKGYKIGLDIFRVDDCNKKETELRYKFLNKYGSLPIADGSSYSAAKSRFASDSDDEVIEKNNLNN